MSTALEGLRVVDLTSNLSGPYCAMLLADQGADVIKVERPGHGDDVRLSPPFVAGESAPFMLWNRNKRSIVLDLKTPDGLDAVRRLALGADVLIENWRPGVAARIGLGYDELAAENPKLIYCSISGFGQTGPYAGRGGFDLIAQAMSGLAAINGPEDGPPFRLPIAISDVTGGMFGAIGVLTAIAARARTGVGQQVDVSLFESAMSLCVYEAAHWFATHTVPKRIGQQHRGSSPYQIFRTKDGHMALGASANGMWAKAATVLGVEHLIDDPRFRTKADRVAHNAELVALLQERFLTETTQHWFERLDAVGVPAGPVLDHGQVFTNEQTLAREMVVEIDHPAAGRTETLGIPVKLKATPGSIRRPAPRHGEHTEEILDEIYGAARRRAGDD